MHASVHAWVWAKVAELGLHERTCLDVGCYATDDLKVRSIFTNYHGVDAREGPNVDEVADGEALPFPDGCWEVVVCTEVLEHCERPWRLVAELGRVLAPGGVLLLTARGFDRRGAYPVHEYPRDFWRFTPGSMTVLCEDAGLQVSEAIEDPEFPGVFAVGVKGPMAGIQPGNPEIPISPPLDGLPVRP